MKFDVFIFVFLIVFSISLSIMIALTSYRKRKAPGALFLAMMQASCAIWSVGYIIEILGTTLFEKMIGVKIQYFIGLQFTPVLWLFSILHFTSLSKRPSKAESALLLIIPSITMILVLFGEHYNFFYVDPHLVQSGSFLLIEKSWGPWFYIHMLYSYLLNFLGSFLLLKSAYKKQFIFKKQTITWLLAVFLPWIVNIAYVLGMSSFMRLDFTNAAFSISAALFSLAINKYGLFELVPTAHEQIITSMNNGLIVIDNAENIVDANPAAQKIFQGNNLIGRSRQEIFDGLKIKWDVDHSKESEIFLLEIHDSIYELVITDVYDKSKNRSGRVLSFYDITDRMQTEKALNESNATKDKFFSIIAHDLRNPFFGILGLSELLANPAEDITESERTEMLGEIQELAQNTYKMLENLLEWSRSQTGRMEYEPENIDVDECIRENILQLKKSSDIKGISLIGEINCNCSVRADRNMLNTVIRNLISNAIKFTPKSGKIIVTATAVDGKVEVAVKDTGIGMDDKVLREVFNLDKTSRSVGTSGEKGTGLGLVLCKEFVEKNNGKIWVESEPNVGSTFTFCLPIISH